MDWILDRLLPEYDFRTRYTRRIAAPPEAVWEALNTVTRADLPITRLLSAIRSGGRDRRTGPLTASSPLPSLGTNEGVEAAVGRVAKFWRPRPLPGPDTTLTPDGFAAFSAPGWAKAAMSFQLTPGPGGTTLLAAETRVRTTDPRSHRAFAPYWLLIRAGGAGLIRLELLRAVARHAESRAS
ncbi:hypothetical protein [Actinocorallia longicatena]|uniref:Polyketide cyclase/dehydrase/lipid transport protein n=1 Tax=Actinocorallia longicatena TaxID=111803 RepID=A0ABP6QMB0_9ACTN